MSVVLEKLVAVATYANVYLQGRETEFNLKEVVPEYCHGLEFIYHLQEGQKIIKFHIGPDALKWFAHLKRQSTKKIRLHYRPSHKNGLPESLCDEIIQGGSNWVIEAQLGYIEESWLYTSILDPRRAGFSQTWKTYISGLKGHSLVLKDDSPSVSEARETIDGLLEKLIAFTNRFNHTKHWADHFGKSRRFLDEFDPSESDMFIPLEIYGKEACQLIHTSLSCWVFGDMSSWNGLEFSGKDQVQYTALSKQLFDAICTSITAVANSYPQEDKFDPRK
ncbi:MAG: hypothetical protein ACTSV2_16330 [Candidatus Thorarchaeota archaeon]